MYVEQGKKHTLHELILWILFKLTFRKSSDSKTKKNVNRETKRRRIWFISIILGLIFVMIIAQKCDDKIQFLVRKKMPKDFASTTWHDMAWHTKQITKSHKIIIILEWMACMCVHICVYAVYTGVKLSNENSSHGILHDLSNPQLICFAFCSDYQTEEEMEGKKPVVGGKNPVYQIIKFEKGKQQKWVTMQSVLCISMHIKCEWKTTASKI